MKKIKVHEISGPEWHESVTSFSGRTYYPNRFSKAELEGIPYVTGPKIIAWRDFNRDTVKYVYTHELPTLPKRKKNTKTV